MPNISEQITQLLEAVGGYGDIISTDLSTLSSDVNTLDGEVESAQSGLSTVNGEITTINQTLATTLKSSQFLASLQANGWAKIPVQYNGVNFNLIVQTGTVSIPSGNQDAVSFPIAFPNLVMQILSCDMGNGCNSTAAVKVNNQTFYACGKAAGTNTYASTSYGYIAIGA